MQTNLSKPKIRGLSANYIIIDDICDEELTEEQKDKLRAWFEEERLFIGREYDKHPLR